MSYIKLQNVTVDFPIYHLRSFKHRFLRVATGGAVRRSEKGTTIVRALDNVSLTINRGDRIGLYGHNGAGKTTLLRVLSGVYEPIVGNVEISGNIAALLDIFLGVEPEASGYENIYFRGLILGASKKEIEKSIEEIIEFSELGDYIYMPMKNYSSGMSMRLMFAISTAFHADIVLMDEWLSVTDASFQDKAAARIKNFIDKASIFVIASHDKELLKSTCNRILCLEQGKLNEVKWK